MRLIDADALKDSFALNANIHIVKRLTVLGVIAKAPTIEAEPVRRGRWIFENIGQPSEHCVCSECRAQVDGDEAWHYCPNCGAKMEASE